MTPEREARRNVFLPDTILVSPEAEEDALTARILARLPQASVRSLPSSEDPLSPIDTADSGDAERYSAGKRALMLTRYRGAWLKSCPGTSDHVCCNLWIVNPGEGCPFDCTYCYLQSYLRRNPTLKLYTNTAEMLQAIAARAAAEPGRLFRVCTGELIDSLVWDELSDLSLELVPLFARLPNGVLELKSKDSFVDNLLTLRDEHQGHTVVSWSMNAPQVSSHDEALTAPLQERIAAAEQVVEAGYRVGFHFDPLVWFEGWEESYSQTIAEIFARIKPEHVAWVSVSTLRYRSELQNMMLERFPASKLPFGEQFRATDNKWRYVQPIRFKMLSFVWNRLKEVKHDMPVYMCMETSAAWRNVAGHAPAANSELAEIFTRRGRLPVLHGT